jgi:beta-glucosidase-like glycosyl hydrolase/CubicO group peptidase (beta-lactamase class C family)
MLKKYLLLLFCWLFSFLGNSNAHSFVIDLRQQQYWVDSVMTTLTLRQRIAQLFMIAVIPEEEKGRLERKRYQGLQELVATEQVGGVIAMRGKAGRWVQMVNKLQELSTIPLLTAIDGEYGVAMRFDSIDAFPRQMLLGALSDNSYIYEMGRAVAQQCRRLGIYMNFAPVADVNNNPNNPVINIRSFGEDKYSVADKSIAYMRGMQDAGILTCAKHFPGHGDTDRDSHHEIPALNHSIERIDSLDLYPFKALMEAGIDGMMMGHLRVMTLDTLQPASLSRIITGGLLRENMEFSGMIFTDALNMKGVADGYSKDVLGLMALLAGNDVLLMPEKISATIDTIEKAVKNGDILEHTINMKCRKMLAAKYKLGLTAYTPVDSLNIISDLNTIQNNVLCLQTAESSITLLSNKKNLLPLKRLDTLQIACLEVGRGYGTTFKEYLDLYAKIDHFSTEVTALANTLDSLYHLLQPYNLVIIGYHNTSVCPRNRFNVDSLFAAFLSQVAKEKQVILNFFGVPYALEKFNDLHNYESIIVSYQNSLTLQERSAQMIFGGVVPKGKLPVSVGEIYPVGSGITWTHGPIRLKYIQPEEIGIDRAQFAEIDSLIQDAIDKHATPGAQVIAAYKGQVFYNKTFGKHTYDSTSALVQWSDLYDLASLTKVSATLPVIMHLVDKGRVQLLKPLDAYLSFDNKYKDKKSLRIVDILAHQSGLPAYAPFHKSFIKDGNLDTLYFSSTFSDKYSLKVADRLYTSTIVPQYIYKQINDTPLKSKVYRYSDWGFMYLQLVAEKRMGKSIARLSDSLFFAPLGMNNTGFLPLLHVDSGRIVPTEEDKDFRKQLIHGYVHDQTASLLGGVAGHAGLFANANDMAKLTQMFLNKGTYGGENYIDSSVIKKFTDCVFCENGNRRGLGFDKPELDIAKPTPVGRDASPESYGHSGYTGTFWWVDPKRDLIYIFLSNRVHPDDDKKLNTMNVRTMVLSAFSKIIDEL